MKVFNTKKVRVVTILALMASFMISTLSVGAYITPRADAQSVIAKNKIIASIEAYGETNKNQRLYSLTESHIVENMDKGLEIDTVKTLVDFDENIYTLFELKPTGYIIYHSDSGKFVEYSSKSTSPYLGLTGVLYYGGAMEYYYQQGEVLLHTLEYDSSIPLSDIAEYAECSSQLNEALTEELAIENISFIEGKSNKANITVSEDPVLYSSSATPLISMVDFFTNLKNDIQIGYRSGGVCGYIAVNMILGYNYFAYDRGLINDLSFVNNTKKTMSGPGLTNKLLQLNGKDVTKNDFDGTTGATFLKIMDKYFDEVYTTCAWEFDWRVGTIDAVKTLKAGFPVALFGNLPNYDENHNKHGKLNHAVVAYGYGRYGLGNSLTKYRVHYGWYKCEDMWLESPVVGTDCFMKII